MAKISWGCCFLVHSNLSGDEINFENKSKSAWKAWGVTMILIQNLIELFTYPLNYPLWWLLGSWLIWLFLRWMPGARPTLPIMLLYSIAVLIRFVKSYRELGACFIIELCVPDFSLFWFVVEVAFWFLVLYVLMKWILRMEQIKNHPDSVMILKR